ncbi:MAG TPA: hypothetical protein PKA88_14335 [Polyangiaceae bacterium]|nr:hypothetical protein [Polyangiaceae bacterium]
MKARRLCSLALASLALACGGGSDELNDVPAVDAGADGQGWESDANLQDGAVQDASQFEASDQDGSIDDATAGDAPLSPDAGGGANCPKSVAKPKAFTGVNASPDFLQVYVNNVENLETPADQCKGDWKDLYYYMKLQPSPDLFLVQQISGKAQLDLLVKYMTDNLPGVFEGIIAEASPKKMNSPCGPAKDYQTNAIIYRPARLKPMGNKATWQVQSFYSGSCKTNFQSRTITVMQKFRDTIANRDVSVASMHWATFQGTGADPACAEHNVAQLSKKLESAGFGGDLMIWGGDANESDRNSSNGYKDWYRAANGDLGGKLGFRDAIFAHCEATSGPIKACLDDNKTGKARIDYLFAKRGDGCLPMITRPHTISFEEADQAAQKFAGGDSAYNYSDHRAIRAAVHY